MATLSRFLAVGVAVIGLAGPTLAQQRPAGTGSAGQTQQPASAQPAPPPAPSNVPEATTASFGDWVLRCARSGDGAQAQRVCEVGQSLQVQGQQGFVAQIAIGRTARTEPLRMTVLLPTNVSFPSSVKVAAEENEQSPFELPWRRCIPGACIADNAIGEAPLQRLRARTTTGRITFKDALGRDVALPISLRGLAQGLDALSREQ